MSTIIYLVLIHLVISSASIFNPSKYESRVNYIVRKIAFPIRPEVSSCTFIRVSGEGVQRQGSGIEYTIFPPHITPQILIHLNRTNTNSNLTKLVSMKYQHTEACSFTWYFLKDDQWKYFDIDYVNSIPGGIFGSYHLVFTDKPSKGYFQHNVPLVMIQMHNLLVVLKQQNSENFEIFTPNVWYNGTLSLAIYSDGWQNEKPELFRTKWLNYGEGPLTVATTPDVLPLDLDEFLKTKLKKKYIVLSSFEFTRYINTTFRILPVRPGIYGKKDQNGKWLGVISEVWKGRAHFSCPVGISIERTEIVSYTQLFAFDNVIFITGLPKEANLARSLNFLVYPFSLTVWISVILSIVLIYVTLILKKMMDNLIDNSVSHSRYVSLSILNVIMRPLTDQTADTPNLIKKVLKDRLSRFLFAIWLLALIVLNSGYKSIVISVLLTPYIVVPPRTFEELAHSKYKLGAVLYNESFYGESFRNLDNEIGRQIRSRVKGFRSFTDPECYRLTETTEHACIGLGQILKSAGNVLLADASGKLLYKESTDGLFSFGVGSSVPKRFPHLIVPLARVAERLQAQGVLQYWVEEEKYWSRIRGQRLAKKFRKKSKETKKDSIVWQLLYIFFVGHSLAIFLFFGENLHWWTRRYLERRFHSVTILR